MKSFLTFIVAVIWTAIVAVLALIPTWIVVGAGYITSPQTFWERFAVYGLSIALMLVPQIYAAIFGVAGIVWGWAVASEIIIGFRSEAKIHERDRTALKNYRG